MNMRAYLLGLFFICGCGIKGPPLPPLENKYEKLNAASLEKPTLNISGDSTQMPKGVK